VFGQDSGDGRSGDLELSGDDSDASGNKVASNDEGHLTRPQLSSSPARSAASLLRFSCGRSEEQLLG